MRTLERLVLLLIVVDVIVVVVKLGTLCCR